MNFNNINESLLYLTNYVILMNQYVGLKLPNLISKLSETVKDIKDKNLELKSGDKGKLGKYIELVLFGNKPNKESKPDLENGYDIKVTKFKKNKKNGFFSAKERLTITNVGSTSKYETLNHLLECDRIEDTRCFPKISKFVMLVFTNSSDINECVFLGAIIFNYENTLQIFKNQIKEDFKDIQDKIKNQNVSQKGQSYLHIHPHGSKNSKTRALGFKNKFVTELFGTLHDNYTVEKKGNSLFIKSEVSRQ